MNQDDKQFMSQFVIVFGALVVFTVVIFVIARVLMSYNSVDYGPMVEKQVAERTAPVGEAHSGEVPKAAQTAASGGGSAGGEQTYAQVCSSCHDSGASGAPMITDKGNWAARIKQGKQTLYDHAINGIGAMPAKGGDPSLSDEEVQAAVDHIVATVSGGGQTAKAAGGQSKSRQTQQGSATSGAPPAGIAQAAERGASLDSESTYQAMCSSCHDSGALGAPMVTDKAQWQARVAMGAEALYSSAINGVGAMPAKGGHSQLSEDEVKGAVDYIIAQVSNAKAAGESDSAKSSSGAAGKNAPSNKAGGKAGAAAGATMAAGKKTYKSVCSSCHGTGMAGAPKYGDKAAWASRVKKGEAQLYKSALNGIGAMPPKGGNPQLSDEDVKAAVDYMLNAVQ